MVMWNEYHFCHPWGSLQCHKLLDTTLKHNCDMWRSAQAFLPDLGLGRKRLAVSVLFLCLGSFFCFSEGRVEVWTWIYICSSFFVHNPRFYTFQVCFWSWSCYGTVLYCTVIWSHVDFFWEKIAERVREFRVWYTSNICWCMGNDLQPSRVWTGMKVRMTGTSKWNQLRRINSVRWC